MSTLQVDRISPYQSASIQIDGNVVQANAATTGSNTFVGDQTVTGWVKETFNDPGNNAQIDNLKVNSWTSPSGHTIANSTIGWQHYDGTTQGWVQELYTSNYAYGSSVRHEPGQIIWDMFASGSDFNGGIIKLKDNGDTTVTATIRTDNTDITGSVGILGNQNVVGNSKQTYSFPANNAQVDTEVVNGLVSKYGHTISAVNAGTQRYDSANVRGFAWDLFTSDFSVGNGMYLSPDRWEIHLSISGSSYGNNGILLVDNGDNTSTFEVKSNVLQVDKVMQLQPQDPLPTGAVGQLAVSGSDLYFHNGSSWILK